jgi:hypothetical protein
MIGLRIPSPQEAMLAKPQTNADVSATIADGTWK